MRVNQLTGHALNWAVSQVEGIDHDTAILNITIGDDNGWFLDYLTWEQAGPIIERENIGLWSEGYDWEAKIQTGAGQWLVEWDESPLIAAMRCYVASKLGEEVEIPTELTQGENK